MMIDTRQVQMSLIATCIEAGLCLWSVVRVCVNFLAHLSLK